MKTKPKQDKVNIITLGCSKNVVDSEVMLTQLKGNEIDAHHESDDPANVVIINNMWLHRPRQGRIDQYDSGLRRAEGKRGNRKGFCHRLPQRAL